MKVQFACFSLVSNAASPSLRLTFNEKIYISSYYSNQHTHVHMVNIFNEHVLFECQTDKDTIKATSIQLYLVAPGALT